MPADAQGPAGGAAPSAPMSPTGGYAATIPLDLPSSRSGVPLPLAVTYTGLTRAGAAGAGWDVPISYVAWQTPQRNRPRVAGDGRATPPRLMLSLGGKPTLMVPADASGTRFVPYLADAYMELVQEHTGWRLRTLDNHEYRFEPAALVESRAWGEGGYDDLWLLTEIRDAISGDRVVVGYDPSRVGNCAPDLRIKRLSYTFDDAGRPLHEIELVHEPWWRPGLDGWSPYVETQDDPACARRDEELGVQRAFIIDRSVDDQIPTDRTTVLREIRVRSRDNLDATSSLKTIRSYRLSYVADHDTDKPRLSSVHLIGEDGASSLPVATYDYGALTELREGVPTISFADPVRVARSPQLPTEFRDSVADSIETSESTSEDGYVRRRDGIRAVHLLRDLTGDGIPDELWKQGDTWHLATGRLTETGVALDGAVSTWSEPAELFEQMTFRKIATSAVVEQGQPPTPITTKVWSQLTDWNGDGRLDVIDAQHGRGKSYWRVWLNEPSADGPTGVAWRAIDVDIAGFRAYLYEHQLIDAVELTAPDWFGMGRTPISRSKSWPRVRGYECRQYECPAGVSSGDECRAAAAEPCDGYDDYEEDAGSDAITEWTIADANGDGFPDLLSNSGPSLVCVDDDAPRLARTVPRGNRDPSRDYLEVHRSYSADLQRTSSCDGPQPSWDNGSVAFLDRFGAFHGGSAEATFGPPIRWPFTEHWVAGTARRPGAGPQMWSDVPDEYAWQHEGVADLDGTGSMRGRAADGADQSRLVYNSDRARTCVLENGPATTTAQVAGEADLNGDGLLDRIESTDGRDPGSTSWFVWQVRFNTGGGYGPARAIDAHYWTRFALSEVNSSCSALPLGPPRTVASLIDLDADGLPDLVRASGDDLIVASLAPRQQADRGGVGRLRFIGNARGATTTVRYANAKRDPVTSHQVPFPENVVSEVQTSILDGSGVDLAPVHYRYGNAAMAYDGMAGRWVFTGYRWQLMLTGMPSRPGHVAGVLTAYDHGAPSTPDATFAERVVAGRLQQVSRMEGEFDVAQLAQYLPPPTRPPFAATTFTYGVQELGSISVAEAAPLALYDCSELSDGGIALSGSDCRAGAIAYRASIESWEGNPIITHHNTRAGRRLVAVDTWGRPTELHDRGDLATTDDDVCTALTYGPGAFPSVVTSVTVTDCGLDTPHQGGPASPRTLAATRLAYDNLPIGQVGTGRRTARWVDRYDDQGLQGTFLEAAYTYDARGQIATVSSPRTLGSPANRTTEFVYDAFGASVISTTETGSDVATPFTHMTRASTWPSRGLRSIDPSGVATTVDRDTFGRPVRAGVEAEGSAWTLERTTYDDDTAGRRVITDTFPGNTAVGAESTAADRRRTTTFLDALGRARFRQTELGASYQHTTLVSDLVRYDALGRVAFAAAPFPADEVPFAPESLEDPLYGVTTIFDRRGRVVRSIEANGENGYATATSIADRVYVSSAAYGHDNGQATVTSMGPDELDRDSPQAGHRDIALFTATGRETRRVRQDPQHAVIDVLDQRWDRLGRVVRTTRYANPAAMSGPAVWSSRFDSLGNQLALEEPGMSARTSIFDEDGSPIETFWLDGPRRRSIHMTYDGLGRLTSRVLASMLPGQPAAIESSDHFHYDTHSGDSAQPLVPAARFLGRLSWTENPTAGRVFYGYDAFGRSDAETHAYTDHAPVRQTTASTVGGTLTQFALETQATSDRIDYVHDSAGRLQQVRAGATVLADVLGVTALGQHRSIRYGNGVTESFTWEQDGRRELVAWTASTRDGDFTYAHVARDAAGRILEETHQGPAGETYFMASYDGLGRLATRAQSSGVMPGVEAYGYDGLGNLRVRLSTTGAGSREHQPDLVDPDRLCRTAAPGGHPPGAPCHFGYDGAGNLVTDASGAVPRTLTYDAGNRITAIARGASSVALAYGPSGRIKTTVTGPDARTVWHFGAFIEERTTPDGARQIERTIPGPLGANLSLRTRIAGATTTTDLVVAHGDGRANLLFTRADGGVAQQPSYSAFGAVTSGASATSPLSSSTSLWNGGDHLPEVGVTLLGPRAYDPDLGRFLQRDPIAILARSTTANPYAFAFSDPVNLSDPTGLCPGCEESSPITPREGLFILGGGGAWLANHFLSGDSAGNSPHLFSGPNASALRALMYAGTSESAVNTGVRATLDFQRGFQQGAVDTKDSIKKWAADCAPGRTVRCVRAVVQHNLDSTKGAIALAKDPEAVICAEGCMFGVGRILNHVAQGIIAQEIAGAAIGVAVRGVPRIRRTVSQSRIAEPAVPEPVTTPGNGPAATTSAPGAPSTGAGPVPPAGGPGWHPVSRWIDPGELQMWISRTTLPQPSPSSGARIYVTNRGLPQPGGTGPVRIDFAVPTKALQPAGQPGWWLVLNRDRVIPMRDFTVGP